MRGQVQGVGYRASTRHEAIRLGLAGWVRNLPDDTVEIVVEGDEARLRDLLDWARRGPRHAEVEGVEASWSEPQGEDGTFRIRYSHWD